MADEFLLINSMFLITGILYAAISLPLIAEKVKPNKWYGYRTRKTFANPRVWYLANKAMGFDMLLAGLAIALCPVLLILTGRSLPVIAAAIINLAVMFLAVSFAAIHSYLTLRRL
jgi:uncharacterized membrane protein